MTADALSAGWQVTVEAESQGWYPFVGDRSVVVGAIAELVGVDLTAASVTIEQVAALCEATDAEYGVWSVPQLPRHVEEIALDLANEWAVSHPMGGLVYIRVETV